MGRRHRRQGVGLGLRGRIGLNEVHLYAWTIRPRWAASWTIQVVDTWDRTYPIDNDRLDGSYARMHRHLAATPTIINSARHFFDTRAARAVAQQIRNSSHVNMAMSSYRQPMPRHCTIGQRNWSENATRHCPPVMQHQTSSQCAAFPPTDSLTHLLTHSLTQARDPQ